MTYVIPASRLARRSPAPAPVVHEVAETVVEVTQEVTVTRRSESRTHLLKDSEAWGWEEVRDYVVSEIEDRFGAFPRDQRKEAAIFQRFCNTYGGAAPIIAQYAFGVCGGWWKNAPIQVTRFCKGSDPYFADPILAALSSD